MRVPAARFLPAIPSGLFLIALFLFPVVALLARGLPQLPRWSASEAHYLGQVIANTLSQAGMSSILAGLVGTGGALLYAEGRLPGGRLVWHLSLFCFSLPTVLVALAFVSYLPFSGWPAIWVAHAFLNFPLFLRLVGTRLLERDRAPEKAALSLGASRWQTFRWVTWPAVARAWQAAFFLSFLYCSTSFVILLLLGGGPRYTTLEVALYQAIRVDLDLGLATSYAVVQWVLSLILFALVLSERRSSPGERASREKFPIYRFSPVFAALFWVVLALLVAGPLLRLASRIPGAVFATEGLGNALAGSLGIGLAVALGTLLIAFPLARFHRHHLSSITWLYQAPAAVSTLVLSLALWLAYPEWLSLRRGGLAAVILLQCLLALPLVYRIFATGFESITEDHYRQAQSLGASSGQILRWIEIPLLRRSLVLGALSALLYSLGEVTSLILFSPVGVDTLTWGIYRQMGRYAYPQAYALALLLAALMAGLLYLSFWMERKRGAQER